MRLRDAALRVSALEGARQETLAQLALREAQLEAQARLTADLEAALALLKWVSAGRGWAGGVGG